VSSVGLENMVNPTMAAIVMATVGIPIPSLTITNNYLSELN